MPSTFSAKTLLSLATVLGTAVVLTACGGQSAAPGSSTPKPASRATPTAGGNITAGKALFAQKCSKCHGPAGQGTSMAPSLTEGALEPTPLTTRAALAKFVGHNMPADAPGSLSATQVANVSAYVWSIMYPSKP
ncbi:MAG: cytochrome c [Firmicutes bacterium]|nr:cytochrome c [Bacillota bacterium]